MGINEVHDYPLNVNLYQFNYFICIFSHFTVIVIMLGTLRNQSCILNAYFLQGINWQNRYCINF